MLCRVQMCTVGRANTQTPGHAHGQHGHGACRGCERRTHKYDTRTCRTTRAQGQRQARIRANTSQHAGQSTFAGQRKGGEAARIQNLGESPAAEQPASSPRLRGPHLLPELRLKPNPPRSDLSWAETRSMKRIVGGLPLCGGVQGSVKLSSATPERRGVIDNGLVTDATLNKQSRHAWAWSTRRLGREGGQQDGLGGTRHPAAPADALYRAGRWAGGPPFCPPW